jgi:DNA-directed RNA polymerase specialized sigma24 family protein
MDEMLRLLERLRPRIERMAGGMDNGDELYAEVEFACVKSSQRYDWLHPKIEGRVMRMARNLLVRMRRRERLRRHACLPAEDCAELARADGSMEEKLWQVFVACRDAVERLPDRYREVVDQHCFGGKQMSSIASASGLPPATIRTLWRRGLQQLARDPTIRAIWTADGPEW